MDFNISWSDILGFTVGVILGLGIFIWFVVSLMKRPSKRDE